MGLNMLVHLYFLLRATLTDCKKKCRERARQAKALTAADFSIGGIKRHATKHILEEIGEDEDEEYDSEDDNAQPKLLSQANNIRLESLSDEDTKREGD